MLSNKSRGVSKQQKDGYKKDASFVQSFAFLLGFVLLACAMPTSITPEKYLPWPNTIVFFLAWGAWAGMVALAGVVFRKMYNLLGDVFDWMPEEDD